MLLNGRRAALVLAVAALPGTVGRAAPAPAAPARAAANPVVTLRSGNGAGAADAATTSAVYGRSGDLVFLCDWDGDGTDTFGLYRADDASWYLRDSPGGGTADRTFRYGRPGAGDRVLCGDWDGDGRDGIGVFRASDSTWYLREVPGPGAADRAFRFGRPGLGDRPLVGDWDGDGDDTPGVFRAADSIWYLHSVSGGGSASTTFRYGRPGAGDTPLTGDWDGDGGDTVGVHRGPGARFLLASANAGGDARWSFVLGAPGAAALEGDWDGDGRDEVGVVSAPACRIFPPDNPWNTDISTYPVHPRSAAYIASIGAGGHLHPDFGTSWEGRPIGIPHVTVGAGQARVPVSFDHHDESDPGPYPIPRDAPIEGGPASDGDRHVLVLDRDACRLYELFDAHPFDGGARWHAGSGAVFDLTSNRLRPDGWTSADAAGLPIYAGLVRYEEVAAGGIGHALRFTTSRTQRGYIHPATHFASSSTDPDLPPMGLRLRLRSGYDCSGYSREVRVICAALKRYGMFVADNGADWFVSGDHDPRWDDDALGDLKRIPGSAFDVVQTGPIRP